MRLSVIEQRKFIHHDIILLYQFKMAAYLTSFRHNKRSSPGIASKHQRPSIRPSRSSHSFGDQSNPHDDPANMYIPSEKGSVCDHGLRKGR